MDGELPGAPTQPLSAGCQVVNDPEWDDLFGGVGFGPVQFFAGEEITATATTPTGAGTPTTVILAMGDATVDTERFPGTVSYTFPATTTTSVRWQVDGGGATWTVSCRGRPLVVPADTTPPTCAITALRAGPPKQMDVTVQDTGSGLAEINRITVTNGTVNVQPFTAGTTTPVVVTATDWGPETMENRPRRTYVKPVLRRLGLLRRLTRF